MKCYLKMCLGPWLPVDPLERLQHSQIPIWIKDRDKKGGTAMKGSGREMGNERAGGKKGKWKN